MRFLEDDDELSRYSRAAGDQPMGSCSLQREASLARVASCAPGEEDVTVWLSSRIRLRLVP